MDAPVIICGDLSTYPSAVASEVCAASQGLVAVPSYLSQAGGADPVQAGEFFGYGFFLVVASYLAGWAVGSITKVVRQGR